MDPSAIDDDSVDVAASETSSYSETLQQQQLQQQQNEDSENEALIVDCESPRQHGNESPSKLTTVSYLFRLSFIIYSCWSLMIYLNNFIRFFSIVKYYNNV